ncbi:hypothetical protein LU293_00215 [Moraxella nasovis]|uniref:hypothetical protein n=1 Tax=Moraxella nasovis TaxID=2904121 RepID=UPI001F61B960|nr:hypothetical protein [Moraxella nasovis]UNU73377.1 hypothetical protein LU293_00215 [Moraxella nasovis]
MNKSFKLLAVTIALSFVQQGHAAYGLSPHAVATASIQEGTKLSSTIGQRVAKSQNALTTAIRDNTALIQEGIALNIKQEAAAAAQVSKAEIPCSASLLTNATR